MKLSTPAESADGFRQGNVVGGRGPWPLTDHPPARYPSLSFDSSCEALVIGAGSTGALIALTLVEAGFDVLIVDKGAVAGASTAANTALLLYELDVPLHKLSERMGESDAVTVYRLCRDALTGFAELAARLDHGCGFAARPSLYLASRPEHVPSLQREHAARRRHGFAVDLLERAEIESRYAFSSPAALLSHDAAEVDPVALTYAVLALAVQRGARVHEGSAIVELRSANDGVEATTRSGWQIRARYAILATGYETERYLEQPRARNNSTYALVTDPLDGIQGWPDRALIWETARPYLYLRTTADDRILIGGLDERDLSPAERDALLDRKCRELLQRLHALFPDLRPSVARAWCGAFLNTADSLPYIGPWPGMDGIYAALCYGGNGTTFSLVAAELLRDLLLGRHRAETRLFGFGR